MDKYRISSDGAQLLIEDFYWVYQEESEIIPELKKRAMTVYPFVDGRLNKIIFFCDQQMRKSYQQYGDVVCVEFKPIKIRKNPKNSNTYLVGLFTGQDTNLHHVLFGVALIDEDKYDNYSMSVKYFLKAMKTHFPKSFVVGNNGHLFQAISDISKRNKDNGYPYFKCLLSSHCLLERMSTLCSNMEKKEKDSILQQFQNILFSLNQQDVKIRIRRMIEKFKNN